MPDWVLLPVPVALTSWTVPRLGVEERPDRDLARLGERHERESLLARPSPCRRRPGGDCDQNRAAARHGPDVHLLADRRHWKVLDLLRGNREGGRRRRPQVARGVPGANREGVLPSGQRWRREGRRAGGERPAVDAALEGRARLVGGELERRRVIAGRPRRTGGDRGSRRGGVRGRSTGACAGTRGDRRGVGGRRRVDRVWPGAGRVGDAVEGDADVVVGVDRPGC